MPKPSPVVAEVAQLANQVQALFMARAQKKIDRVIDARRAANKPESDIRAYEAQHMDEAKEAAHALRIAFVNLYISALQETL